MPQWGLKRSAKFGDRHRGDAMEEHTLAEAELETQPDAFVSFFNRLTSTVADCNKPATARQWPGAAILDDVAARWRQERERLPRRQGRRL
jgi:hypothetical protein